MKILQKIFRPYRTSFEKFHLFLVFFVSKKNEDKTILVNNSAFEIFKVTLLKVDAGFFKMIDYKVG